MASALPTAMKAPAVQETTGAKFVILRALIRPNALRESICSRALNAVSMLLKSF
jgi:hypothetical protein